MSEKLIQGIVRILNGNGYTAGTGFVVSESRLIATCSHVIQNERSQIEGEPCPKEVKVIFHATGEKLNAKVAWWLPCNAGDLAVLRIEATLPSDVQPLLLGSPKGTDGHEICTFGFPGGLGDIEGIGGDGKVVSLVSRAGNPLIQLRSKEITLGFSGAPVWDKLRRRVIGIVSDLAQKDSQARLGETAFAISTETLKNLCPDLQIADVCPYLGLAAFKETDVEFFHGRKRVVDDILDRLRRDPYFLTILGPSGSGKSSVVQAGLIPHLKNGPIPRSDLWEAIVVRPADNPLDELAKQGVSDGGENLTESVQGWQRQHPEKERLVLIFDQFEEVFVNCPEEVRQRFIEQILQLLQASLPVSVILVMRDDFYSRMRPYKALVQWVEERSPGPYRIPRLREAELVAIVQKPAEAVGLRFGEGLVQDIVDHTMDAALETGDEGQVGRSTVLPLLESALQELWKKRDEGVLTRDAYKKIGAIGGALTNWADEAFSELQSESHRQLARRIFTDLIYLGDEKQGILDSRRRRTLTALYRQDQEQKQDVQYVVQHLALPQHRLLVTDRDSQTGEETVEMIHDVLRRAWARLKDWVREDRPFLQWHQEVEKPVSIWKSQHDKNKLLRGRDLQEANKCLKERRADLSQDEIAFIRASTTNHRRFVAIMTVIVLLPLLLAGLVVGRLVLFQPDPTYVTNLQDDGVGSLRWAIANAPSESTIMFDKSLRGHTILLTGGDLIIGKNLTIRGPGADMLSISSGKNGYIVHVLAGVAVTISGLTFKDSETDISFIENEAGTLTLNDSTISGNTAQFGGGIDNNKGGTLTLNNSTISGNTAAGSGGGIFNDVGSTLTLNNSTVSGNTETGSGGGISSITGSGGGIFNESTLTLNDSTISGNTANGSGGGVENSFFSGTLTLNNSTISGNTATGSGGGIDNVAGTLTLTNSTISGNSAKDGGGIATTDRILGEAEPVQVTLLSCTVKSNTATGSGGGIDNESGTLTLTNSTISGNSAKDGGGIVNAGTLTLTNSTVSGNRGDLVGGGIVNVGTLTLTNSTISGNSAKGGGGIGLAGTLTLTNSTISGNSAIGGSGGGIAIYEDTKEVLPLSSIMVLYCTIYGNTADAGGGIWAGDLKRGHMTMGGSIVAGNNAYTDHDIEGPLTTLGYNLVGDRSGGTFLGSPKIQSTDILGVSSTDLKIDPVLRDNGGSARPHTWTHALLLGSPAIDFIPPDVCTMFKVFNDQRGVKRPQGKGCDSGAYEYVPA